MSYRTEMMEQILQSKEGQRIVSMVTPLYGEAYAQLWLFQIIGAKLDEANNWSERTLSEVTPQTATWSIAFWEKEYGIVPESWWSLNQRRENIINHMNFLLPMNPVRLADIASTAAGVPVEVRENSGVNEFEVLVRRPTDKFKHAKSDIDKYKPAHLVYLIRMAQQIDILIKSYIGIGISQYKKYKVKAGEADGIME